MGKFSDAFLTGWTQGRERAQNEAYQRRNKNDFPVKLIEPSTGRIVELEVTEQNDFVAQLYMKKVMAYAKGLEKCGTQWQITGRTIRIVFPNDIMAEDARQILRK